MTKLDEAIKAAAEAYFQEPCDDLDQELADNFCAAIQAAVKAVVPEAIDIRKMRHANASDVDMAIGYNKCRRKILKNAGVE